MVMLCYGYDAMVSEKSCYFAQRFKNQKLNNILTPSFFPESKRKNNNILGKDILTLYLAKLVNS